MNQNSMPTEKEQAPPRRSIQTNVIVAMVLSFIAMFALLYGVTSRNMETLLVERENDSMVNQAHLAHSVLMSSVNYLPSVTRDWSSWDDTYAYVLGEYPDFMENQLNEYPFQLFRINFITILDAENKIVYEEFYDFWESEFMAEKPDLSGIYPLVGHAAMSSFEEGELLDLIDTTQIGKTGFLQHDGQIYYMSAYPVIHSDETGPCVGTFIYGRIINESEIDFITSDAGLDFSVASISGLPLPEEQTRALLADSEVMTTQKDTATAYVAFADIFGETDLAVSYTMPRTLYAQGQSFIGATMALIALCLAAILLITVIVISRVVRPFRSLAGAVDEIDMERVDKTLRRDRSNKEVYNLADSINNMLSRIKQDRDIIVRAHDDLYQSANYDGLTGLRNRRNIGAHLRRLLEEARENGEQITVFYLDMDRFKFINDTVGHTQGDELLMQVADRLRDALGGRASIARMGGDEFLLTAKGLRDEAQTQDFVRQIFGVFARPFQIKERNVDFTVSIGASTFPEDGPDDDTLIKNAELAMYQAKKLGESCYVPYEQDFQTSVQRRVYIENELRSAIGKGCQEFEAYFQPKISMATGEIDKCEALIRWITPNGVVSPMEFIPQAEESGLIIPLTWWMIRECCRAGKRLADNGMPTTISINVSAQGMVHDDLLPTIRSAVEETGMDISRLDIEITESTLLEDFDKVNEVINQLHQMGLEVSIDDFGTGYSSLSYLSRIAVDRIKIDASFIRVLNDADDENKAIVRAIVAMSDSLRMVVTAEGVETRMQYDFLRGIHCEEAQGYYMARPAPLGEYIRFLENWDAQSVQER